MKGKFYNTKEAAQLLGISKQTLFRYEKKKIFPPPRRNPINNRREYTQQDILRLKKILGRA
ncbi:MAG TPA: MerR family transcriptional regulator [Candidatus Omnitrophica bacterium]|nr:MAG: hypothetical protein DRP61_03475 [Candidatus Omnitrophota bacterium]RKY33971.1 MAG: hypothetical protein DRP69_05680 [Candidatus Omnitrophota bacterium]RKY43195.1 MAG: hypothetical protein DRP80_05880 [Candidatus Omnitrophota bacterium]HEC68995.1 MerR family transcriptional regulator [Candidatus Omnitrophota bacterium]